MTSRAASFLGAGAAAVVASRLFGAAALMPVGVAALLAPLLGASWTYIVGRGTRLHRTIAPPSLNAGDSATITIARSGWAARARLGTPLNWEIDCGVTGIGTVAAATAANGDVATITDIRRGHHVLGPVQAVIRDPFGLTRHTVRSVDGVAIQVRPALLVADAEGFGRLKGRGRPGQAATGALDGTVDILGTRDYRPGDRLNRVNWRQTAKRGELQTLELVGEDPGRASQVVLLDAGLGTKTGEPTFELAVAAAATIAEHLIRAGRLVTIEHSGSIPERVSTGHQLRARVSDCLTRVDGGGRDPVGVLVSRETRTLAAGRGVIVVLSSADPTLTRVAAAAVRSHQQLLFVLVGGLAGSLAAELRREGVRVIVGRTRSELAAVLPGAWTHAA